MMSNRSVSARRGKIKKTALVLLFCLFINALYCQHFVITPFVGNISFPSNELHGIVEDEAGNKWVASDAGLIKITGNKVKIFTKKDGLATDVILRIYKDQWKRIWMAGPDGSLSVIDKGRIIAVPANAAIRLMDSGSRGISSMCSGSDKYLYAVFIRDHAIFRLSPDLKHIEKITAPEQINNGQPLYPFFNSSAQQKKLVTALMSSLNPKMITALPLKDSGLNSTLLLARAIYQAVDGSIFIAVGYNIFRFNNGALTGSYQLPGLVYAFTEVNNKLLLTVAGQGLYVLDKNGPVPEQNILFKKTITSFLKDSEGNLWITTLEAGLFVVRNTYIGLVYNSDANITDIMLKNDEPVILADKQVVDLNGRSIAKLPPFPKNIFDIAFHKEGNDNVVFYLSNEGLVRFSPGSRKLIKEDYFAAHLGITGNREIFWGSHYVCIYINSKRIYTRSFPEKIMSITQQSDSFLLAGTFASGILRINITDSIAVKPLTGSGRVNCIQKVSDTVFAIGTNEDGVQLIDDKGKLLLRYKNMPNRIQTLVKEGPLLFAGTKEGLYMIDLEKNMVTGFNNSNGLPANEITRILVNNDTAYLAGVNIAVKVPVKALLQFRSALGIDLEKVTVNNRQYPVNALVNLSHGMNNFSFSLNNYSYRGSFNTIYYYTVREGNKIVLQDSTADATINFSLEPGSYKIDIYAEDRLLNSRSNMISFPANIASPFYTRLWFLLLSAIAFVLITILVTARAIKKVKAKELLKRELVIKLSDLEARALQGQMNPHFIFNAVNSVQDFILSNRNEEAHHYLSTFAKLVRMVLESNRKKNVTVEEEINLLQLYVSLEEQRMKEKLHLDINIAESVEKDNVLLPSMLLQPIVENAIWHGLNRHDGKKNIAIAFDTDGSFLTILISDNGRGLQQPKNAHAPVGLEIVRERIRLAYEQEPAFEYFSISGNKENGVQVHIVLPLQTAY